MADAGNAKVLTAKVEFNTSDAEKKIQHLSDKINGLNKAFSNIGKTSDTLDQNIKKAASATDKLEKEQEQVEKAVDDVNKKTTTLRNLLGENTRRSMILRERFTAIGSKIRSLPSAMRTFANSIRTSTSAARETEDVFDRIYGKIKAISATYLGMMGARELVELSDTLTSAQNRLNDYNSQQLGTSGITTDADGNTSYSNKALNATTDQMNKMFGAAQRARVGYDEMMKNVSKSMVLAGDSFNDNIDNAIYFQEIMGKAYTLGGASAAEQASSMYQMIQALGAGTLAGDELRSVREGAPLAYQAIEEYAQGVLNSTESLKDMASQGMITSDIVVAAMMTAGDEIENRFANTAMTFGQAMTMMKNTAVMAFKPVLQYMNDFLNSETGQKALEIINEIIVAVSYAVGIIVRAIAAIITFIVDNWNWIKPLLVSICVFIAEMILLKIGGSILRVITMTIQLIASNPVLALVTVLVALIVGLMVHIAKTAKNVHDFLCKLVWSIMIIILGVLAVITTIFLVTGTLVVSTFAIWVLIAIALIALVALMFLKYTDVVLGVIFAAGAIIWNFIAGVLNAIIQYVWSMFVEPISGIIEWFVNAFNGGFDSVLDGFLNLMGQMLSALIGFVKPFAKLLDTVFGWDTNGMITEAQNKMKSWGKNDDAVTFKLEAPELKRLDVTDSYDKGAEKGTNIKNKLENMQVSDIFSGMASMDGLVDIGKGMPDPYAPEYALETDDPNSMLGSTLGDISDDTSKISDSMDIRDTELKYLKELGEREAINKFTTAEIRVEMKNDNYISERVDMDGVVNYLSDKLYEELGVVANGVHY